MRYKKQYLKPPITFYKGHFGHFYIQLMVNQSVNQLRDDKLQWGNLQILTYKKGIYADAFPLMMITEILILIFYKGISAKILFLLVCKPS